MFWIIRDSVCAECGDELGKGRFLRMEAERPLCLACADLDHLVFLSRGDAALTRRASRYSTLRVVVVRFSRSRKRYERQGVLVEEAALTRAEQECLSDAEARQLARERAAERRQDLDAEYVEKFARRVGDLFPGCPREEQRAIAEHACQKYSVESGAPLPPRSLRRVRSNWPFAHMCATRTRGMTNSCRAGLSSRSSRSCCRTRREAPGTMGAWEICARRSETRPVGRSESDHLRAVHSTLFSSETTMIGCGNVGISRSVRDFQAAVEIVL